MKTARKGIHGDGCGLGIIRIGVLGAGRDLYGLLFRMRGQCKGWIMHNARWMMDSGHLHIVSDDIVSVSIVGICYE
jgi:hypothetical protein